MHTVVESLGVVAATELWRNPTMMNVVQRLCVDLGSVRLAIAVNTEETTLAFGCIPT